jgi:hypothetical protein
MMEVEIPEMYNGANSCKLAHGCDPHLKGGGSLYLCTAEHLSYRA